MISAELNIIRALIRPILAKPFAENRKWQVQGLGMLRTYIDKDTRLHVWDARLHYCEDSGWHTHPWNFSSFIAAGTIRNRLYREQKDVYHVREVPLWKPFTKQHIICGPGGCAISEPEDVFLMEAATHTYYAGESYQQTADEIHASEPSNGAVSVITRQTVHLDGSANVYYPSGSKWTSAEARRAQIEEISEGCKLALATMDGEIK